MITIPQKMILSFLFSVFLFTGITVLIFFNVFNLGAVISAFPQLVQILILPASFLALFLVIFFYINLWQYSAEKDDIICLMESDSFELVNELENISPRFGGNTMFSQPFAFSLANPELLQEAGNEVIYERNGIHYINDDAFTGDRNTEREINNDFAQLVESVVNIKL
jgi:hypothetical protein